MIQIGRFSLAAIVLAAISFGCGNQNNQKQENGQATVDSINPLVKDNVFGKVEDKTVQLFTLTNKKGDQVKITSFGAAITAWTTADINGKMQNVVVGFDSLKDYLAPHPYFGATIGRYANRIAKGKFTIDGKVYQLPLNDGQNSLHGGLIGFDKVVWTAEVLKDSIAAVKFSYESKDGEQGYPGNLKVSVIYSLGSDNALKMVYDATTDKATPVNFTNHTYFNLSGDFTTTIFNEDLQINADKYTPVDTTLIPTGELKAVKGTAFDFTTASPIGKHFSEVKGGYDHNFVLNKTSDSLTLAASLTDSTSGRNLKVYTTEPGIQFYAGNFLDGTLKSSGGIPIIQHNSLTLETQHFPDSPNHPKFPNTILKPGEQFHSVTIYQIVP